MPLLPKKRAANGSSRSNSVKRQKLSGIKTTTGVTATAVAALVAQNAAQSPLLRLPSEIRNMIWEHAFGNKFVHVHSRVRAGSFDNPGVDDPWFWTRFEDRSLKNVDSDEAGDEAAHPTLPGPVCRQFLAEASGVFYSSCTFGFLSPMAFRGFARANHACVPRIRKIEIHLMESTLNCIQNFPRKWRHALTVSLVGRFHSLEGVSITGVARWDFQDPGDSPDFLNRVVWKMTDMPMMVRAFRQFKLKAELASVDIQRDWDPHHRMRPRTTQWDTAHVNKAIREELLKHEPRRVPKRGTFSKDRLD